METNTDPNAPAATPPAATPPAAGAPPADGQPGLPGVPATPPAAGAPPAGALPKKKKKIIRMPEGELLKKVKRLKDLSIQNDYGMSPAELKALVESSRGNGAPPASPKPAETPPAAGESGETKKLRDQLTKLQQKNSDLETRLEKNRTRERDKRVATMIAAEARVAGVLVEHLDFAIEQYRKVVSSTETPPDPSKFFTELRKTKSYLYGDSAPALPQVRPGTAPPESGNPGEARPSPGAPGTPPAPPANVDEMDQQKFNEHRRSRYGY